MRESPDRGTYISRLTLDRLSDSYQNSSAIPDSVNSPQPLDTARVARRQSRSPRLVRRLSVTLGVGACLTLAAFARPGRASEVPLHAARRPADRSAVTRVSAPGSLIDSLRGRSRKLRARFLSPTRMASVPILRELFGDSAASHPGVYATPDSVSASAPFHFITMRPFADKVRGRIGTYRIGFFPAERRGVRSAAYTNPEGFLEVTASNQDTHISEHFRLRDFLTHDQATVWPKYLVLQETLVDKLELVLSELRAMGIPAQKMRVMSGFRTPQYNEQGVGAGGRVQDSRHQYGDAADVYVVNGTRDWMSDLNGDGRVDIRDARVLAKAAERVEQAHPELAGGIGVYMANSVHGPFVHIDVRGQRARWGSL